jgi:nucleoside-diphosphate-sugar epimerase
VRNLAELIRQRVGYTGKIEWDKSRPDGQPRRKLDTTRAQKEFGWQATTQFDEGLRRTIDWFVQNSGASARAGFQS